MSIITHKKIFFGITAVIIFLSIVSMTVFGLELSTEFTGGTLIDIRYDGKRPSAADVSDALSRVIVDEYTVREAGEHGFSIRARTVSPDVRTLLSDVLSFNGTKTVTIDRMSEIGPSIGTELRNKSILAISLVLLFILFFIAFAFRKVSKPVSSWMYGGAAIIALVHNVVVTFGFYALLGHFLGASVDTLFVTAVLTVIGFSVHDTIVVFDRLRENLRLNQEYRTNESFEATAGKSLNQTIVRSINTSLTVLFTLLALYFVGPVSTQYFSLTLLVGIVAGTYSSIAFATPLLVAVNAWRGEQKNGGK